MNGGEIETLFVERIAQLLKPKGVAAVILPSSILSNDSASYTSAREQFLQNFYIRAIVALGSKTFGATGTNTVVMFLEKFNEPPKQVDLFSDTVDAVFSGVVLSEWKDREVLEAYLEQIKLSEDVYRTFLNAGYTITELQDVEYFKMYVAAFDASADVKNLQKMKSYKNKSSNEQAAVYLEKFYAYAHSVEKEKLFYFSLVYRQVTVIITAPADNKEQKNFLVYDWSNRKGNEGIQIITPGGKLYDASDRTAKDTLADVIRQSFNDNIPSVSDEQKKYVSVVNTADMFDFSRVSFNKAMRLSVEKIEELQSKYPVTSLGNIAIIIAGQSPESKYYNSDSLGLPFYQGKKEYGEKYLLQPTVWTSVTTKKSVKGDILMSVRAPVGDINLNPYDEVCIGRGLAAILTNDKSIKQDYLYYFLKVNQKNITGHNGLGFASISMGEVKEIKVPVPPISVQKEVVSECEKIDDKYNTTRMSIENYRKKIEELFNKLDIVSSGGVQT